MMEPVELSCEFHQEFSVDMLVQPQGGGGGCELCFSHQIYARAPRRAPHAFSGPGRPTEAFLSSESHQKSSVGRSFEFRPELLLWDSWGHAGLIKGSHRKELPWEASLWRWVGVFTGGV